MQPDGMGLTLSSGASQLAGSSARLQAITGNIWLAMRPGSSTMASSSICTLLFANDRRMLQSEDEK